MVYHARVQQGKAPKPEKVPTPAAPPAIRAHKLMPRGEFMVLQELFCGGVGTAPIRKQALDFGLGLYAADQLEQNSITTAKELTDSNIRSFETKLVVSARSIRDIHVALGFSRACQSWGWMGLGAGAESVCRMRTPDSCVEIF